MDRLKCQALVRLTSYNLLSRLTESIDCSHPSMSIVKVMEGSATTRPDFPRTII